MATQPEYTADLLELRTQVINTFDSETIADLWLNRYHPLLGEAPIAAAGTPSGLAEVRKILNAINYGGAI